MTERLRRLRVAVVGVTLVAAAVVVVLASADPNWPVPGFSTVGSVSAVLAVGFALAAALHELAGERERGLGNLLAFLGWLTMLVGEILEVDLVTTAGVVVVLAAGAYLVWLALD